MGTNRLVSILKKLAGNCQFVFAEKSWRLMRPFTKRGVFCLNIKNIGQKTNNSLSVLMLGFIFLARK